MNNIIVSDEFKRKVKSLAKKYHTLKSGINDLGEQLKENPYLGESYGADIYKIRLADKSKGRGKSGGFRVIYYLKLKSEEIFLITIFDKSERDTITKQDAKNLVKKVLNKGKVAKNSWWK